MGIQDKAIENILGASVLVIDQACDNNQLLISLCRNGSEWLSPVGWTEKQKITLLECRSHGGKTEIDIPAEFAKVLVSGDTLVLKCSELDLTQEIIWKASHVKTRPITDVSAEVVSEPAGFAKGVLSRFLSSKTKDVEAPKSDAQRRAEEADRAAQSYREKMEAATAAKEEAQRKALEAAREAEAALKMEAERIAEMERAAKAFEEAERLKQDELRRVEEERRAEEARIAEEARRIEKARKREEDQRREAERKAALERYVSASDITQNEQERLQTRLTGLKADTEDFEARKLEQETKILSLNEALDAAVKKAEKSRTIFEKMSVTSDKASANLVELQHKSDSLSAENTVMQDRVSQLEADYHKAQREAEMAKAFAEEKRMHLESLRQDKELISGKMLSVTKDLQVLTEELTHTTQKTRKLRTKLDTSLSDLESKKAEIETSEHKLSQLTDSRQTQLIEIEAIEQAIEDCQARLSTHQEAIAHLEAGGDPKAISDNYSGFDSVGKNISDNNNIELEQSHVRASLSEFSTREKRSFLWNKAPKISIDVDDVTLEDTGLTENASDEMFVDILADAESQTDVLLSVDILEGLNPEEFNDVEMNNDIMVSDVNIESDAEVQGDETQGFLSRHSKTLFTIGTILGSVSILGGGYALLQPNQPQTLTVKTSYPSPVKKFDVKQPVLTTPSSQSVTDTKGDSLVEKTIKSAAVITPANVSVPHLTPTGLSLENVSAQKLPVEKNAVAKSLVKDVTEKKITPKIAAPLKSLSKSKVAKSTRVKNYPELTTRVQTQLQSLGFYRGSLNGQQTDETIEAIKSFQSLYGLPQHGRISGRFLSAMLKVEAQQKAVPKHIVTNVAPVTLAPDYSSNQSQLVVAVTPNVKAPLGYDVAPNVVTPVTVADNALVTRDYNQSITQQAFVKAAVPTSTLSQDYVHTAPKTPAIATTAEADIAVSLSSPPIVPRSIKASEAKANLVVEAKRIKSYQASYPFAATKGDYFVDVKIVVAYDIDAQGKVINSRIVSNDNDGKYKKSFDKEAMKAVKRQKFSPKTVNGQAVQSTGQTQRILFKAG